METHNRRSIRLSEYDYSSSGAYFITLCTGSHGCLFGEIVNGDMRLNEYGEIVRAEWLNTIRMRTYLELDAYVVMPDHFHGIIVIHNDMKDKNRQTSCFGRMQYAPTTTPQSILLSGKFKSPAIGVGAIVRGFKAAVVKRINVVRNTAEPPVWQRNFYERIIRNETELKKIREYIQGNPKIHSV